MCELLTCEGKSGPVCRCGKAVCWDCVWAMLRFSADPIVFAYKKEWVADFYWACPFCRWHHQLETQDVAAMARLFSPSGWRQLNDTFVLEVSDTEIKVTDHWEEEALREYVDI